MLTKAYNIIIEFGVGASGNGIDVVYGLNDTNKSLFSMLGTTVQLPDSASYESHFAKHTSTANKDISLAREFQKHLSEPTRTHGLLYHGKYRKHASKQIWTDS